MEVTVNLLDLKEQVTQLEKDVARAEGSLTPLLMELKVELGADNLKDAQRKLQVLKTKAEEVRDDADKALSQFEKKWGQLLQ